MKYEHQQNATLFRFRRPSSSFSLTGPMNLSPYRPRHDSSSSESESNGRRGDRRVMEGLVEAGERQREEDLEAARDAEASLPKDQMRGTCHIFIDICA